MIAPLPITLNDVAYSVLHQQKGVTGTFVTAGIVAGFGLRTGAVITHTLI